MSRMGYLERVRQCYNPGLIWDSETVFQLYLEHQDEVLGCFKLPQEYSELCEAITSLPRANIERCDKVILYHNPRYPELQCAVHPLDFQEAAAVSMCYTQNAEIEHK